MTRLTLKQVQEYAKQHGYMLEKSKRGYILMGDGGKLHCRVLLNVVHSIKQGYMLVGGSCEWQPQPSDEPWEDEPTEPNPEDDSDEPTDSKSFAVSFAPPIKVIEVFPSQNTAQICIGELIKTVDIDEQGISEQAQVLVQQRKGSQTLQSKVKLVVAFYPEDNQYYAYPLAAHGGWVSWIDPPKPYTAEQFNIAFNRY